MFILYKISYCFPGKVCSCWEYLSAVTSGNDLLQMKFWSVGAVLVARENWAWACFLTAWRIISMFIILRELHDLDKILHLIPFDWSINLCGMLGSLFTLKILLIKQYAVRLEILYSADPWHCQLNGENASVWSCFYQGTDKGMLWNKCFHPSSLKNNRLLRIVCLCHF